VDNNSTHNHSDSWSSNASEGEINKHSLSINVQNDLEIIRYPKLYSSDDKEQYRQGYRDQNELFIL